MEVDNLQVIHLFSTLYAQIFRSYPHFNSCSLQNTNVILSTYQKDTNPIRIFKVSRVYQMHQIFKTDQSKEYNAKEVQSIRKTTGFSQKLFASYMGVSAKTVEAWEAGTNRPSGTASRILSMMEMNAALITQFPFVKMTSK